MKYLTMLNKSKVAKTAGLALVSVLAISMIGFSSANTTYDLTVTVNDICGPVVAQVTIVNGPDDGAFGITDQNGQFTFDNINAGVFYLHITAADHASQDTSPIILNSDQSITVTLDRTNGGCTPPPPPQAEMLSLDVTVNDICGPVVAQVTIVNGPDDGAFGITDQNGRFTFTNLSAGVFYLHITAADHASQDTNPIVLDDNKSITVTLDRTNGGCTPPPSAPTCVISAHPTSITSGQSSTLSWTSTNAASATLDQGIGSVATNGSQAVSPTATTHYTLTVQGNGGSATCSTTVTVNQPPVENRYNLDVTVNDICGPVVAQVTIVNGPDDGAFGFTDANGHFTFTNLRAGVFYLHVTAANHVTKDTSPIVLDSNKSITFTLDRTNGGCTPPPPPPPAPDHFSIWGSCFGWPSPAIEINANQVANANTYTIQRRVGIAAFADLVSGLTYTQFDHYADTSVVIDQTYEYRVIAVGNGGSTVSNNTVVITASGANCGFVPPPDHPPVGSLDHADCTIISGWAKDPDNSDKMTVKIFRDGNSTTGVLLATLTADQFRADVGSHGFSMATPAILKDGASHTVSAYVVSGATLIQLSNSPKTVFCPITPPAGTISVEKTVRNITDNQSGYAESVNADPGDEIEFKLEVRASNGNVENVRVTDTLPSRLIYIQNSLKIDGVIANNNLSDINLGNMSSGQTKNVTLRVNVAAETQFSEGTTSLINTGSIASNSNSDADTAEVKVTITPAPEDGTVSIAKTVRNSTDNQTSFAESVNADPDEEVEFRLALTATGGIVHNVKVTDTLPSRLTYVQNSLKIDGVIGPNSLTDISLGDLSNGQTKVITFKAKVASASQFSSGTTTLTNVGLVNSDSNSGSDTAEVKVTINPPTENPSITLTKTARNLTQNQTAFIDSIAAVPGDRVEFRIEVSSNGHGAANDVVVVDTLPANLTLDTGNLTTDLGDMNEGSTRTIFITAQIAPYTSFTCGSSTRTNLARATSSNASSSEDSANAVVTRTTSCGGGGGGGGSSRINLTLTKEVRNLTSGSRSFETSVNADINDRVEFRITIENTRTRTARDVRVTDNLPNGLEYISGTFDIDSGSNSGNLFGSGTRLGDMRADTSRVITFEARVTRNGTLINQAEAKGDNTNSPEDEATVRVSSVAGGNIDLILSKKAYNQTLRVDATSTTARVGDVILYTLTVENRGNSPATNYVFHDDLADVLQFSTLVDFGNAEFNMGNLSLRWPVVSIPAHSTVEKTFTVRVNKTALAGQDNTMTNTFGNTVNVRVPIVGGVFVPPKTGATMTLSLILAALTVAGLVARNKKDQLKLILQKLTH